MIKVKVPKDKICSRRLKNIKRGGHLQLFLTSVNIRFKFGHSRSLAGQFGFGLAGTEFFQMPIRHPIKEAEYSASAPVSAELFGFVCSLLLTDSRNPDKICETDKCP